MKKIFKIATATCLLISFFTISSVMAQGEKIIVKDNQISGYSDPAQPLKNIVDGDTTTFWKSVPQNGVGSTDAQKLETRMNDHNRYINIKLDGVYNLDKITIYNNKDSANNYYIYASEDGKNFEKIVSKIDGNIATEGGNSFRVDKRASYIRLNMAYNSATYETNLAEIELYGTKVSEDIKKPAEIKVSAWEGSSYQKEWDKFETNTSYANSKTIQEMKNLVARVIGKDWTSKFQFEIRNDMNGNDVFEIENGNGVIIIRGNDGVSLASGFNYYLKNYAKVDYNPLFDSNTNMQSLVKVDKKIVKETEYDVRYALNFCTYSYTMAFWGWDEYQEFLDWAAMNGVNVVLDIVGQEEVLRQTLKQYNFTDDEIKEYIAGPGYFAWFYMQNLYSFGGPLPDNWFEQRVELGRKMHDRMQAFGIDPVIQGFSGQVPLSFDDKNEGAVLTPIDQWPSYTRPAIIKTYLSEEEVAQGKKDYFKDMAKVFYDAQKNIFGDVSNYYAADPFHEGGNAAGLDIANIFATVQTEMINNNEDAVWVLQQWQGNLNDNNLKGLVKPEQALALDLHANKNPENGVMEKYSVPWVWNMLHNFGGRMGLDGDLETIATQPAETMVKESASHMVGIGITPEALENSPIMYELLFDMTWEKDPINLTNWVKKYAERRAGGSSDKLQEAWDILRETAYNQNGKFQGAAETVINARPGMNFTSASTWGHSTISYEKTELDKALHLLIDNYDEFKNSPAYRYDIADVAEQVLCNAAVEYHKLMVVAYNAGDSAEFKRVSDHFIQLISLSDKILGSTDEFMAGTWIKDARDMLSGADDWTKDLFEFNARALITTWGGQRSGQLKDYSNRKWAGLTEEFYQKRWEMWISNRQAELDKTSKDPIAQSAESNWFLWEWQWANRKSDEGFALPTTPNYTNLKEYVTTALTDYSTTSLKDFGSSSVEEDVNISEGKLFTTNPDTSEDLRKKLSDGEDESAGWEVHSSEPYTFTLDLEGTYEVNSIEIYLKNLAVSFEYNYEAEILNAKTNEWQKIEENAIEETMSRKTIITLNKDDNKEATQVRITMKTRDAIARPLLITELRVKGKALHVATYYNVAKGLLAESSKPTENSKIEYITDDDINTLWKSKWASSSEMYPTTVNLDLKNTYDVASIELYLEKIGLPYKFKVITMDSKGTETIVLDKSDHTTTLNDKVYKIKVDSSVSKVKIVYEGTTGQGLAGQASPAMMELKVLSLSPQKEVATKGNQALNKPVTASSTQSGKDAKHLNDGSLTTSWNFDGYSTDKTPNTEIDLQGKYLIHEVNLQFKAEGYEKFYIFDIYVIDKNGQKKIIKSVDDNIVNEVKYNVPVNLEITKVGVDFKGKKAGTGGWFDIVELEAIGIETKTPEFIFGEGQITGIETEDSNKNAIDGNLDTFVTGIKDKELVFDLGTEYYVDKVDLTFEKAELGLRYIVYSEGKDGVRTLVHDASNVTGTLGNRTLSVKINRNAKKIIFKHLGNNGDGPAYAADPRLHEIAAYMGTPEDVIKGSTIDNEAAGNVNDNDAATSYTMNNGEVLNFDFAKATDINIVHLKGSATKSIDTGKVEAYDLIKKEWVTIYDGKAEDAQSEYIIVLDKPVFTNKIRLTALASQLIVNEFKVYKVDVTQPLVAYIKEVKTLLASKRYEDNNGSYKPEAKAAVEAILTTAETKITNGMSSTEVEAEIATIKVAVKDFNKNGIIYVDRSMLLSNINYAKVLVAKAEQVTRSLDVEIVTLKEKIMAAEELYKAYNATQTAINSLNTELETGINTVYTTLDVDSKFGVKEQLAKDLLVNTKIGDKHGYVPQSLHDALQTALSKAQVDFASSVMDKLTVLNEFEPSIQTFKAGIVVVDKTNLLAMLDSVNTLKKAEYDFTTWKAFDIVVSTSQNVYDTEEVSQAEVNQAATNIETTQQTLVKLDKSTLRQLIDMVSQLQEKTYTEESWKVLMDVYTKANILYNADEVTQEQIKAMQMNLTKAKDALVKTPETPEKPEQPSTPETPEQPSTPETPEQPDTPESPSIPDNDGENVKPDNNGTITGDSTNMNGYIVILGASMILALGIFYHKRCRKNFKDKE